MFLISGTVMFTSAIFRRAYDLDPQDIFIAIVVLIYGSLGAGISVQFMGDVSQAKKSKELIFTELNKTNRIEIDPKYPQLSLNKRSKLKPDLTGDIVLENVYFKYPTRK